MQIPYFSANQDPQRDRPEKFVLIEEARRLRSLKTHFFGKHGVPNFSGVSAIIEVPQGALRAASERHIRHDVDGKPIKLRGNWMIVGQTAIPGTEKYRNQLCDGPGFPHYSFV